MSARVMLDVFSGLPNPQWVLENHAYEDLLKMVKQLRVGARERGFEEAEWGYKGFVITSPGRPTIRIVAGVEAKQSYLQVNGQDGFLVDADRSIEAWLLRNSGGIIEKFGLTFEELTRARNESTIKGLPGRKTVGFECETGVEFPATKAGKSSWNNSSSNCYNYANDHIAPGANPAGPGPNNKISWTTAEMIEAATDRDKLELLTPLGQLPVACPVNPDSHYLIICMRDPMGNGSFTDFHCLRMDKDGKWSHKDGAGPVRRHDDIKNEITDLHQAHFKIPLTFVGFFVSTKGVRRIN